MTRLSIIVNWVVKNIIYYYFNYVSINECKTKNMYVYQLFIIATTNNSISIL